MVVAGAPHHVTQRGNNRQHVFRNDRDYIRYLRFLREEGERHGLSVLGFCLMPNHVHLIVLPATDKSMGKAIGRAHCAYTQSFHTAHGGNGHLWQSRYYSTPLDSDHLVAALAYVELNPLRARLVRSAPEYAWSSARAHVSGCDPTGVLDLDWWKASGLAADWRVFLSAGLRDELADEVREATLSGQPRWKVDVDSQG